MNFLIKKIIPYILVLVIFITSICTCYYSVQASSAGVLWLPAALIKIRSMYENSEMYQSWYQSNNFWTDTRDAITSSLEKLGLPHSLAKTTNPMSDPWQEAIIEYKKLCAKVKGKNASEVTDDEAREYVNNAFINCHFGDNNIEFSNDMNILLKNYAQDYIDSNWTSRPVYSFNLVDNLNNMPDGNLYNALRRFILAHQDEYEVYVDFFHQYSASNNGNNDIFIIKKNIMHPLVLSSSDFRPGWNLMYGNHYDFNSWEKYAIRDIYRYNHDSHEFEYLSSSTDTWINSGSGEVFQYESERRSIPLSVRPVWVTVGRIDSQVMFHTLYDMKASNQGIPSYFITNTWNNFVNNQGDTYTIDNSNINTVTYGDVVNHIENITNNGGDTNIDAILQWIQEENDRRKQTDPTPTPTPGPSDPVITPTPTPTQGPVNPDPTPGPGDYNPWGYTVSGNGTGDDTGGWSFWDFLKNIFDAIGKVIKGIGSLAQSLLEIPKQIFEFFTIDTEQVSAALSEATVSMNNLKNEVIPSEQIKSTIAPLNMSEIYYPKLTIKTPAIIRQYYDEEEIILLDFEKWAKYFVVVRGLLVFSFWFAFIYHTLASVRPHIDIGS